jgi:hypothetical protein
MSHTRTPRARHSVERWAEVVRKAEAPVVTEAEAEKEAIPNSYWTRRPRTRVRVCWSLTSSRSRSCSA